MDRHAKIKVLHKVLDLFPIVIVLVLHHLVDQIVN